MNGISVAIITYNSGELIGQCLESVEWADEIIVVDGGSSDDTLSICSRFPRVKVLSVPNNPNLDVNKNIAIEHCIRDWILVLDSDETVTPELADELKSIASIDADGMQGYFIPRRNFFLGRWMKASGWYPDYILRFFRRGVGKFPCAHVHERLEITGETGHLKGDILHLTYRSFKEYFDKMDSYTSFEAAYRNQLSNGGDEVSLSDFLSDGRKRKPYFRKLWWRYMPLKPCFRFFLILFFRKGFLDGRHGFMLAVLSAVSDYVSDQKYRMLQVKSNTGEGPDA